VRASSERIVAAVIAFGCAVGLACNALVTFEAKGPPAEAGVDTQVESDAGPYVDDPCAVDIPKRPTVATSGGTLNLVFAAHTWGFEHKDRPLFCHEPGFNLDGLDTGPEGVCDNPACKARPSLIPPSKIKCDADGGVDNAFLAMLGFARGLPTFAERLDALELSDLCSRGVANFLVQVAYYNGEADDQDVVVTFYVSAGMEGANLPERVSFDDVRALPTVWDGTQDAAWIVDERSVNPNTNPPSPAYYGSGYVRANRLVVPLTGPGILPLVLSSASAAFEQGTFTARITKEGERWQLAYARLATRLPSVVILSAIGATRGNGEQVCSRLGPEYEATRGYICGALDLPLTSKPNNPELYCETMSVAFAFASSESRLALRTPEGGLPELVTGRSALVTEVACPDDAGSTWCDDCAWEKPDRCAPN
jgi:hypothetical protein